MNDVLQFKVGDKIVDYGQMYIIFKIKKDILSNGEKEDCIYYRPYYKKDINHSLVCSIPESSIEKANIRKPVSKKKIIRVLKLLGKKPNEVIRVNIRNVNLYFKYNDPIETARLLKLLWLEKQEEDRNLSTRKKAMYKNAMRSLVEEVSIVQMIDLKIAIKKICGRLKKIHPEKEGEENDK